MTVIDFNFFFKLITEDRAEKRVVGEVYILARLKQADDDSL